MTSVLIADPLPPGEWARHPASLVEDAYRDGWAQRLGLAPTTFPRQLNTGELTAWTRGHAAAHRATVCVLLAGAPLRPSALPVEEVVEVVEVGAAAVPQAPTFDGSQLCAQTDPELFFPEKGGSTRDAKRLCGRCEFRRPCLEYALDERIYGMPIDGVWGGTSVRERRALRLSRDQHPVDQDDELVADVAS